MPAIKNLKEIYVSLTSSPSLAGGEVSKQVARALFLPAGASLDTWLTYSKGAVLFPYLVLENYDEFLKACNGTIDPEPCCSVHFCIQQGDDRLYDFETGADITDRLLQAAEHGSEPFFDAVTSGSAVTNLNLTEGDFILGSTFYYPADVIGTLDFGELLSIPEDLSYETYLLGPTPSTQGLTFYPLSNEMTVSLPDSPPRAVTKITPGSPFPPYAFLREDLELLAKNTCSAAFVSVVDSAAALLPDDPELSFEDALLSFGVAPKAPPIGRYIITK